jgi:hypothetical protein
MRRENCITVCIGPDCEGCRNYKTEVMKTAEDYIKEKWGVEWLSHDWEAGDVIDALDEYAKEVLREELIKYDKWCAKHWIEPDINTAEKNVDGYLKEKEK